MTWWQWAVVGIVGLFVYGVIGIGVLWCMIKLWPDEDFDDTDEPGPYVTVLIWPLIVLLGLPIFGLITIGRHAIAHASQQKDR